MVEKTPVPMVTKEEEELALKFETTKEFDLEDYIHKNMKGQIAEFLTTDKEYFNIEDAR